MNQILDVNTLIEIHSKRPADEMNLLGDVVVNISESTFIREGSQLCNILGAIYTNDIIPGVTTHIVTNVITPLLKQQLNMGSSSSVFAPKQEKVSLKLFETSQYTFVTPEWLKQCLIQQKY